MSTKPLRSLEKSLLTGRVTISPHRYTASGKSSLTKSRKPSDDSHRIQHETQSSFFPQRQDRRDITSRKKLVVDPKTGKLRYPSLLFQKIALKESIKKSLTKGSLVRGDSEEDEVEEVPFEDNARGLSGSRRPFGGVGMDESRYFIPTSKDIGPKRSALYHHSDAEEVSSAGEYEAPDDEFLENRKYSMYEDWRIIETIDEQIREHGIKGYLSKGLWKTLIDPRTGSRLLDGTRTPESMRERYKKWLVLLTEEDKEELRRFARRHNEAEMKNSCCAFRKVDRTRRFDGVAEDAMGTYSTLKFINTPRKSSSKKMTQSARYTEEKSAHPKIFVTRPGGESAVRERLVFTERKADKQRKESAEASRIHTTVKKSPAKVKEDISTLKRLYIPVLDNDDVETVEKQRILDAEKLNKKNDQGEFRPMSKKIQKSYETPEAARVSFREIPGGKRLDFSQINLKDRLTSGFKGRRYMIEELSKSDEEELVPEERFEQRPADPSLNVYVDMNRMMREFVKENDERGRHTIKLIKIAEKYGLKLDDALKLFNAVSGDYEDLKLYLQNGDVNLLWTEDDDHGLILNNKTAIRYLKLIKGEKRMERRKMYLLGRYERRRRASHSAH